MLEKIGLPPKPSMRGNNWVVDASHCQGCSSQFTFINRKHHCRRCGGLFCNSCTQQRMVLRGQGDSPVRICEPCKTLEEAARFEIRYGHKNRAGKGGSKLSSKREDETSNQVLNYDNTTQKTAYSASSSNIQKIVSEVEGDIVRNLSLEQGTQSCSDIGEASPEDLRQQALELERQAAALELSIRKNRKKALSLSTMDDIQQNKDDFKASIEKNKSATRNSREKDDLSSELKELGWSDIDLRDTEKKAVALTLEGELSSLIREVSQKPHKENKSLTVEKSQVIVHKKKALELKRAGNLVEAKEELKRAKILEKKIEEEELLGQSDDSDDELSSLMHGMAAEENDFSARFKSDNFDLDQLVLSDLGVDGNFEVTDEDMDDPEMVSALKSLGWTEDTNSGDLLGENVISNRESLVIEVQSLKREAVTQKRVGNTAEAMALLKKAKVLEKELKDSDTQGSFVVDQGSISESAGGPLFSENVNPTNNAGSSKLAIQKDLISLKRRLYPLRREGKFKESEEELKRAKVLEIPDEGNMTSSDGDEEIVTDQDMNNPSYLSLLKNLGWNDEDNVNYPSDLSIGKDEGSKYRSGSSVTAVESKKPRKGKSDIQRELLTLKRKALTLRRQGETEEADEVLKMAKSLEAQLQAYEEPTQPEVSYVNNEGSESLDVLQNTVFSLPADPHENKIGESRNQENAGLYKSEEIPHDADDPFTHESTSSQAADTQLHFSSLQTEILAHKRKAVTLKRDGKMAEAKEELRKAKLLEKRASEETSHISTNSNNPSITEVSSSYKPETKTSSTVKPLSSRERFKLQQESLNHKRQALKLRREGKTAEADAELELAKALESQLQDSESLDSSKSSEPVDDVSVEDLLDPQLLSALRSLGLEDAQDTYREAERPEPPKSNVDNSNSERDQLMQLWKAEKVKAVNLKRSGNQAEALESLRRAKLYEKKLQSLTSR
ncbi:myosin heavy chain, non-muscle-like [Dorcoceras hygrometricum]|uniref:Myosin heavy chain, non-muscle-like n=1 Tax=Dorcoceras hygrometricum TaxID=472368 RepID=A0A2Z7CKG1_9LAMI|nr:myosin heavy chain, non-muscle-like [Dorcoceras hygrometricum]